MTGGRKTPPHDPTAERAEDQSTHGAGGLHQGVGAIRSTPPAEAGREADDTAYRNDEELYKTPRHYDEDDTDPTMPSNDSSLNTKI